MLVVVVIIQLTFASIEVEVLAVMLRKLMLSVLFEQKRRPIMVKIKLCSYFPLSLPFIMVK
jgi:hypothetical protein